MAVATLLITVTVAQEAARRPSPGAAAAQSEERFLADLSREIKANQGSWSSERVHELFLGEWTRVGDAEFARLVCRVLASIEPGDGSAYDVLMEITTYRAEQRKRPPPALAAFLVALEAEAYLSNQGGRKAQTSKRYSLLAAVFGERAGCHETAMRKKREVLAFIGEDAERGRLHFFGLPGNYFDEFLAIPAEE